MPESYISATDNVVRSFEGGFGRGVQMEHEDFTLRRQQQQQAFRDQQLNERYALQYRNNLALTAVKFAQKAQLIGTLSAQKAAVMQNTELKKGAIATIDDQIKQYRPWTLPSARGNIKNPEKIDAYVADLERRKLAISQLQPAEGNNGVIDKGTLNALMQPKAFVQPEFTDSYQKFLDNRPLVQESSMANQNSQIQTREERLKMQKDKADTSVNNNLYHFQANFNNVFAVAKPLYDAQKPYIDPNSGMVDFTKWRQNDPIGAANANKVNAQIQKAKEAFTKNPKVQAFIDQLQNPYYVPQDIAEFVVAYKGKFGNLSSWDDMQKFTAFVKDQAVNGDEAHKKIAQALDKTLSGNTSLLPEEPEDNSQQQQSQSPQPAPSALDDQMNSVVNDDAPENPYDDNTGQ